MFKELSGMGGAPAEQEYLTILLGSLPKSYGPLLTAITMAASIAGKVLKPENIIIHVNEEFDRRAIETKLLKANENALAASSRGKGKRNKGQDKKGSKDEIECWGCGKLGHIRAKCKDKMKGNIKKGKGGKEGNSSANVAPKDALHSPVLLPLTPLSKQPWCDRGVLDCVEGLMGTATMALLHQQGAM